MMQGGIVRYIYGVKRITTYIVLFAFSASLFINAIIVADYLFFFHYYSTEVCENKAAPEMNCQGTCYLQSQLQNEEKSDEEPLEELREFSFDCDEMQMEDLIRNPIVVVEFRFNLNKNFVVADVVSRHFHPPRV